MQKIHKYAFLSLILVVPTAIFVFFQQFGENKFDLPIQFMQGRPSQELGCNENFTKPYQVDSFLVHNAENVITSYISAAQIYVVVCLPALAPKQATQIKNTIQSFENQDIKTYIFSELSNEKLDIETKETAFVEYCFLPIEQLQRIVRCHFLIDFEDHIENTLLIDKQHYIRGIYNLYQQNEVDRLQEELKVLSLSPKTNKLNKNND